MTPKLVLFPALVIVVAAGCTSERARREDLGSRTDSLYEDYMNGNRTEARRSIVEANRLVEQVKLSNFEQDRATFLFLNYGRLYSIDHRAGSNDLAQADLIKARYWCLRSSELNRDAPDESIRHVEKFTKPEKLLDVIDQFELTANHGKQPRYIDHP
jgi:hypothetical protein